MRASMFAIAVCTWESIVVGSVCCFFFSEPSGLKIQLGLWPSACTSSPVMGSLSWHPIHVHVSGVHLATVVLPSWVVSTSVVSAPVVCLDCWSPASGSAAGPPFFVPFLFCLGLRLDSMYSARTRISCSLGFTVLVLFSAWVQLLQPCSLRGSGLPSPSVGLLHDDA